MAWRDRLFRFFFPSIARRLDALSALVLAVANEQRPDVVKLRVGNEIIIGYVHTGIDAVIVRRRLKTSSTYEAQVLSSAEWEAMRNAGSKD